MKKLLALLLAGVMLITIVACESKKTNDADDDKSESVSDITSEESSEISKYKEMLDLSEEGDVITFGTYEQDNNINNGKEEIEWIVLKKADSSVLVISKYALDHQLYNTEYADVTWETCTLRTWLNDEFINNAFSVEEQTMIRDITVVNADNPTYATEGGKSTTDKVFLLGIEEAEKYFADPEEKNCMPTEYAKAQGVYVADGVTTCWWWLRSPGKSQDRAADVVASFYDGYCSVRIEGGLVNNEGNGIRPAMWISLEP